MTIKKKIHKLSLKAGLMLLFLSFGLSLNAALVNPSTAANVARNFLRELSASGKSTPDTETVLLYDIIQGEGQAALYIFNIDAQGFMLIAAEDEVYPVLGWSLNGTFNNEDIPPALTEWLDSYRNQIVYLRSEGLVGDEEVRRAWEHYAMDPFRFAPDIPETNGVEPLLQSTWGQGNFYNTFCPPDAMGPNGKALVGCVAVAMGQVLYYYRYPAAGTSSSAYTHSTYGYLSADYGNTTYRWNEMGRTATGKSHLATAELLYHMGVSVQMNYGPSASGAYSHTAAQSLKNYFGYDQTLNLVYKYDYSDNSWASLMKSNLDAGHPMYYHGYGSGGHAFNVDGYQNNTHFHFNWGWGGTYDGYFYLSNLNPGGQTFTSGQGAIINFKPPASAYPSFCNNTETVTGMAGTIEDGSGPIADYQNMSNCTWLVQPTGLISHIEFNFRKFSTEPGQDILYIYDGDDDTAPLLAAISGDSLYPAVVTSGDAAFLRFVTNGSGTAPGWLIAYEAFNPVFCTNFTMFTSPTGIFDDGSTVNHPYNDNTNCKYMIQPTGNNLINLSFNYFSLEDGKDFLRIYDPTTIPTTLLATFTGNATPPDVIATNGQMMLIFYSDNSNNDLGWEVSYTSSIGIDEPIIHPFSLYPNPAATSLTIDFPESFTADVLMIFDVNGKVVLSRSLPGSPTLPFVLDISDLPEGVYLVRAGGFSRKMIVRR
ncbi:MAG: C10 family peptidase [Bacteroidales bacterium]